MRSITPSMARPTRAVTAMTASRLAGCVVKDRRCNVLCIPDLLWLGSGPPSSVAKNGAKRFTSSAVHAASTIISRRFAPCAPAQ